MKSKWLGLNTHSMVYQQLGVGISTSYGCKPFFSSWTNPKKTDLKKNRGTGFANYKMDTLCRQPFGV